MKGLIAALAMVCSLFLLIGCASQQANPNQDANQGINRVQGPGAGRNTKIILYAPSELPEGKVGQPYSYSFCNPAPSGIGVPCGGINPTTNPSGGKGPYSFYLASGTGFPPTGLSLNINGILSGTPSAAGYREFEVCAKDVGGDYACNKTSITITDEPRGLAGAWELTAHLLMNGPEGSFPAGCEMELEMQLDFTQVGDSVGGVSTNRLAKTTGCGIWSIDIQTPDRAQVSGSFSAPTVAFSIGTMDFTGTIAGDNMAGTVVTCHSPDPRCSKSGLQQLNWYSGNFNATRTG